MSFDRRHNSKSYTREWADGQCALIFTSESKAHTSDPKLVGRTWIDFNLTDKCRMRAGGDLHLSPPLRGAWLEEIKSLMSIESTESWHGISALIDHAPPRVPPDARELIRRVICAEARDAAEKALFLEHSAMWVCVHVDVLTDMQRDNLAVELKEGDGDYVKLACNHEFHVNCVVEWVKERHLCPICRPEV